MQILWDLKKGFVNDIIDKMPEPKPAYNTVSTIVRILEAKDFVEHKAYGKTHEYYPTLTKELYTRGFLNKFMKNYFSGSYKNLVSFFSRDNKMTTGEIEEIIEILQNQLESKK